MPITAGIIGYGRHGQFLLERCRQIDGIEIRSIYRRNQDACAEAAKRFGVTAARSYQEILSDRGIDAVFITSPSSVHREHCEAALAAGKHVFLEKPLASTLKDAEAIAACSEKHPRQVLMVDYCERFNPAFIDAKEIVRSGQIGELRVIQSSRLSPLHLNNPRWDLGALDVSVHNVDLICWFMDATPTAVSARSAQVNAELPIHDNSWITLEFAGGRHAEDFISWVSMDRWLMPVAHPEFMLLGTKGFYQVDLTRRTGTLYQGEYARYIDDVLLGASGEYLSTVSYAIWHFMRAVNRGGPSPVTARDAVRTLRLVLAARESIGQQGKRITISETE
jgi:predicted dehydrogenase